MLNRRAWLMALGIPGLLLYATLGVAQWRSSLAMNEFTRLQKAHPPDSLKKAPAKIQLQKLQALTLAERLAPDNPEIAYQTSLLYLVRAETESLQPPSDSSGAENAQDPRLVASLREGLTWINRAITLNPGVAEYQFVKASILQNLSGETGDQSGEMITSSAVFSLLREADKLDPYKPSLHFRLGSFWIALDNKDEARKSFGIALADTYNYARPIFNMLWSTTDSFDEIRQYVANEPLARALLGDFLYQHGYEIEAEREYAEALLRRPIEFRTGEQLIFHYFRTRRFEEVRNVVSRMTTQGLHWSQFQLGQLEYYRAKSFLMEERWQAAIESYERVLSLDSSNPESHLQMAIAYLHANQPHKAAARLNFVLAHFSEDPAVKTQLGEIHFRLGEAIEATGNIGGALVEYLKASSVEPTNAAYSQKVSNISGR